MSIFVKVSRTRTFTLRSVGVSGVARLESLDSFSRTKKKCRGRRCRVVWEDGKGPRRESASGEVTPGASPKEKKVGKKYPKKSKEKKGV